MRLNKIYNIDCFDFIHKLDDDSIDLLIADPPYNLKIDKWDYFENFNSYLEFNYKWINLVLPKLKKTASLYIFNTPFNNAFILNYLIQKNLKYRNWITWYKKDGFNVSRKKYVNNQESILFFTKTDSYVFNYNAIRIPYLSKSRIEHASKKGILKNGKRWFPNEIGKLCPDVWEITSQRHKEKINGKVKKLMHPTPKPLELINRIILASSNQNDLVLDLFSGIGSTSLQAINNNRNFIGCEINKSYCKIINERLKNVFTKPNT